MYWGGNRGTEESLPASGWGEKDTVSNAAENMLKIRCKFAWELLMTDVQLTVLYWSVQEQETEVGITSWSLWPCQWSIIVSISRLKHRPIDIIDRLDRECMNSVDLPTRIYDLATCSAKNKFKQLPGRLCGHGCKQGLDHSWKMPKVWQSQGMFQLFHRGRASEAGWCDQQGGICELQKGAAP